ncbi:Uncharacterised protein [Vibrio cholerae]|nr:Uncharacterised protein [Vibrio cholerae]
MTITTSELKLSIINSSTRAGKLSPTVARLASEKPC